MPVLIPTWTACGTVVGITAAATRMGSTGLSSEEGRILWRKLPWWYDLMQTPSINSSVIQTWKDFREHFQQRDPSLYHKHILDLIFILHFFLLDAYCIFIMSSQIAKAHAMTQQNFFGTLTGIVFLSCLGCYVQNQILILINIKNKNYIQRSKLTASQKNDYFKFILVLQYIFYVCTTYIGINSIGWTFLILITFSKRFQ